MVEDNKKMSFYTITRNFKQKKNIKKIERVDNVIIEIDDKNLDTEILHLVEGRVVVDESKLHFKQTQVPNKIVIDDELMLNSSTFAKNKPGPRWNKRDTDLFYKALFICGTELSLVTELFQHRTRKNIKNKFKKELKCNAKNIENILKTRKGFNMDDYENLKVECKKI